MADIIDCQNVLVSLLSATAYPNGTGAASITNTPIILYPGWPSQTTLTTDLAAGKCHVTVFPTNIERNTTRYPTAQQVVTTPAPTLTALISGQTVTIGGTVSIPQNVAISVNGTVYTYAVQLNDTLTTIATGLSSLIAPAVAGTTNTGPVITFPSSARIAAARIGASGTVAAELKRQERGVMITVWANSPALRDQIAGALDVALAATEFVTLPDGYAARLIYKNSVVTDALQKSTLYRRDLVYTVEYATTQVSTVMQITGIIENITPNNADSSANPTFTTNY